MNFVALHVYHLDDNEEADAVIALLTEAGVADDWPVERPNEDTNAILLPIDLDDNSDESTQVLYAKLDTAVTRLRMLQPGPFRAIREMGLTTAMRIHTDEFYLALDTDFVAECSRLGLEICIFNERAFG